MYKEDLCALHWSPLKLCPRSASRRLSRHTWYDQHHACMTFFDRLQAPLPKLLRLSRNLGFTREIRMMGRRTGQLAYSGRSRPSTSFPLHTPTTTKMHPQILDATGPLPSLHGPIWPTVELVGPPLSNHPSRPWVASSLLITRVHFRLCDILPPL